ncbi:replication protein [Alkalibacillus silvisoli]|uniref:Replication protein n=1 Tax=Alkalibacillus silvisoli TaxID=392823 RepID=A0ABN1AC06_9BACI
MNEKAYKSAEKHTGLHHDQADGYVTLARKTENGFHQYHYKPSELATVLSKWLGEDIYFSQNTFYKPQRQIENIRQLRSLYADVDCYLLNYDPEWVIGKLELELMDKEIPEPNLIIHSGRGLALVWLIEPLPYKALPLWQAVQDNFLKKLKAVGGDPLAKDAARVFRVAGSVNSKSGEVVKVQYRHNYRYVLRDIQEEYLPNLDPKRKPKRGRPSKVQRLYNTYSLHHARLMDLIKLINLRNYDLKGHREYVCFLYRYWLCCYTNDPEEAFNQTMTLNLEFTDPLPSQEVERATRSAEKAFYARNDEEANALARQKGYPGAGYNISNNKLIDWLEITEEEQKQLSTIIGKTEKYRRNNTRRKTQRRNEGVLKRSEYNKSRKLKKDERKAILKDLMQQYPNATYRELAERSKMSVGYVHKLAKEL